MTNILDSEYEAPNGRKHPEKVSVTLLIIVPS